MNAMSPQDFPDAFTDALYDAYLNNKQVITDSRQAAPGTMFFALKGTRADGNAFVADVLARGCRAVVTSDRRWQDEPGCFCTDDVLAALQALAARRRMDFRGPVVGITGSNGKTTTKELTCAVLRTAFRVHATSGNFNNHLGVPLTLLAMPDDTGVAVVEMGANHTGEIAGLCRMVCPTHALVTNVSKAHIGEFGSFEHIVHTKRALYESAAAQHGTLFAWTGHPQVVEMVRDLPGQHVFYGTEAPDEGGLVPACRVRVLSEEPALTVEVTPRGGTPRRVPMQLVGGYNAPNVAAAACIGFHFGLSPEQVAEGLASYVPSNNRSQLLETARNLLWVDCYNANPASMALSVASFLRRSEPCKMLILGDMGELGPASAAEHRQVLDAIPAGQTEVLTVGACFAEAAAGRTGVRSFACTGDLQAFLAQQPVTHHFVLLKGSHSMQLDSLIPLL